MLLLGEPIPQNSLHSISVSLPNWSDIIGYEEKNPLICNALKAGYPRFVIHHFVKDLCQKYNLDFIFPSYQSALEASQFAKIPADKITLINQNLAGLKTNKPEQLSQLKSFWQHTGQIISSRQALYYLQTDKINNDLIEAGKEANNKIKKRIASLTEQNAENIYLFPNGMSALFAAHQICIKLKPQTKTLQFGFPYTDTLKIQEKFGFGNILCLNEQKLNELSEQELAGIFCEFPSNPLLESPNLEILNQLAKNKNCPLIVDDTIGTYFNLDLLPSVDIIATSLIKFFSGVGDVMGGALILNPKSNNYKSLKNSLDLIFEDICWAEDLIILEKNSIDFADRMKIINKNTETLCDFLANHDEIEKIYYPKYSTNNNYLNKMKTGTGFGGLFSLVLKDKSQSSKFYDNLNLLKGPSLGTNYTLVCPYVLLAHYNELDWVETCGVDRHLIRVSVGLEEVNYLINTFKLAFNSISER